MALVYINHQLKMPQMQYNDTFTLDRLRNLKHLWPTVHIAPMICKTLTLSYLFSALLFTLNLHLESFQSKCWLYQLIRFKCMWCSFNWKFWKVLPERVASCQWGYDNTLYLLVTAGSLWGSCIISALPDIWYCHTLALLCFLEQTIFIFYKSGHSLIDTSITQYIQVKLVLS